MFCLRAIFCYCKILTSSFSKICHSVVIIWLFEWKCLCDVQVAGGLCDNLLTCIVRAWDFSKPMFVAPAMNTFMWTSPFTQRHLTSIEDLGIIVISPISKKLACGDTGNGAMAEPAAIDSTMRLSILTSESIIQHQTAPSHSLAAPPNTIWFFAFEVHTITVSSSLCTIFSYRWAFRVPRKVFNLVLVLL